MHTIALQRDCRSQAHFLSSLGTRLTYTFAALDHMETCQICELSEQHILLSALLELNASIVHVFMIEPPRTKLYLHRLVHSCFGVRLHLEQESQ